MISRRSFVKASGVALVTMPLFLMGCSGENSTSNPVSNDSPNDDSTVDSADSDSEATKNQADNQMTSSEVTEFDTFEEALRACEKRTGGFFQNRQGKYQLLDQFVGSNRNNVYQVAGSTDDKHFTAYYPEDASVDSLSAAEANFIDFPVGSTIYTTSTSELVLGMMFAGNVYLSENKFNAWSPDEIEGVEISSPKKRGEIMADAGYTAYGYWYGSDNPSSFTWGKYEGTKYTEKTEQVKTFALLFEAIWKNKEKQSRMTIALKPEKTKNGYFTIDTSEVPAGIYMTGDPRDKTSGPQFVIKFTE